MIITTCIYLRVRYLLLWGLSWFLLWWKCFCLNEVIYKKVYHINADTQHSEQPVHVAVHHLALTIVLTITLMLFSHPPSFSLHTLSPLSLPSQSGCRAAPVILSPVSRTPPCGGNSSNSSAGSASMRTAAAACQSNCTTSGGFGCRNRTKRATR